MRLAPKQGDGSLLGTVLVAFSLDETAARLLEV
jgi:hypothetical protein